VNVQTEIVQPHANIAIALAAAQAEMGKAVKQSANPAFRTKYADLASVIDACLPALTRHGIALTQPVVREGDELCVETTLIHASGERLSCSLPLILGKRDMQGLGSAITYARRYGLMCMAGIAQEDDDGNAAVASALPAAPEAQSVKPAKREPSPADHAIGALAAAASLDHLAAIWRDLPVAVRALPEVIGTKDNRKRDLQPAPADDLAGDQIPY